MYSYFNRYRQPTAKKEHKCDLCGGVIKIGEKYCRNTGVYISEFYDDKHHIECERIIHKYCNDQDEYEYEADAVNDWVRDRVCIDCDAICQYGTPCQCPIARKRLEVE